MQRNVMEHHNKTDRGVSGGMNTPYNERQRSLLATAGQNLSMLLTQAMAACDMKDARLASLSFCSRAEVNKARNGKLIPSEKITQVWDTVLGTGNALTTQAALDRAERGRCNSGPGRPHVVVPHQLPATPMRLFGRHWEATRVGSDLITDGIPVIVIASGVGMGSTSLAATVAAQVQENYRDGLLYAHGHGHTPGRSPATAGDILAGWLAALGVRAIPSSTSDRAELYRRLLRKRRLLMLVDDAASGDQVQALLPGDSPSKVLVTTRHRLSSLAVTSGARIHTLAPLADEHAWEMLTSRIIDTPDSTGEERNRLEGVVRMCAGAPLAIAAAAELINARGLRRAACLLDHQPLAALDAVVHDAPDRSLTAGYRACWDCLSDPARDSLTALAADQPVCGLTRDHEAARDELVREHLVSENRGLSPLLRAWIRHHAMTEDQTDVA